MVMRLPTVRFTRASVDRDQGRNVLADVGKLTIRGIAGVLLVGHGTQKLFGAFGGPGLAGTSHWLESMRLRPGRLWALMAGTSEAGGGVLMSTGFLHPLGPIMSLSAMIMALAKGHWGKPIWSTKGGGELPLTNAAIAVEQLLQGPGKYALDTVFGIKLPRWLAISAALGAAGALGFGLWQSRPSTPQQMSEAVANEKATAPLASE